MLETCIVHCGYVFAGASADKLLLLSSPSPEEKCQDLQPHVMLFVLGFNDVFRQQPKVVCFKTCVEGEVELLPPSSSSPPLITVTRGTVSYLLQHL